MEASPREEPEEVAKTVTILSRKHEDLRSAHDHLQGAIRENAHHAVAHKDTELTITKEFAEKSMATIAAWMLSKTFNVSISWILVSLHGRTSKYDELESAAIYAILTFFAVPFCLWLLRGHTTNSNATIMGDQKTLLKLCLPMFFAWAWKDFVSAFIDSDGKRCPDVVVALVLTILIGMSEALPCFKRSQQAIKQGGSGDTLGARIAVMPGSLGLAVGFAWNTVFARVPLELKKRTTTHLFILMIQVIYYIFISSVTVALCIAWYRRQEAQDIKAEHDAKAEHVNAAPEQQDQQIEDQGRTTSRKSRKDDINNGKTVSRIVIDAEQEVAKFSGQVFVDSLGFIYAWAQLDTVNAFFFNYMLQCSSAGACSYQSNFVLAAAVTVIFTRAAHVWRAEHRHSLWNKHGTVLAVKSLSLNVGWAWSNYCSSAVADASTMSDAEPVLTYLMCTAFAWLVISVMHHKFEVEHRAWSRHVANEASVHGFGVP